MFDYHQKTLNNGLRVVSVPVDLTSVVVDLFVGAGGKYEQESEHGLAHFLEHMAFKGTKKRPDPLTMAKELDKIGAVYNASTSKDRISYWVKNTAKYLDLIFDFVSDIVFNARMVEEEIERERGVILEEINMYEDTPKAKVNDLFRELALGDNLLGRSGLGTKKSVRSLKRKDFLNFKKRLFSPENMVLAVAGNSKDKDVFKLAEKWFGKYEPFSAQVEEVDWQSKDKKVFIDKRKTEQTHLILGQPIFGLRDDRRWPMAVLKSVLGTGMSSRLWNEIREKRGWAYYVYASTGYYTEAGLFRVGAGIRNEKAQDAIQVIKDELVGIGETITKEEFDNAKEGIRGRILLSLESTENLAEGTASSWLREGKLRTVEEALEKISKVSLDEAISLAKEIFKPANFYLAAIGPHKELEI